MGGAALLAGAERIHADPYAQAARSSRRLGPIRVRGRVRSGGEGLAGVAVSDGLEVVATDSEGRFELVTRSGESFLRCSIPAGQRIPQNETGTARAFQPILPDARGEAEALFDLEALEGPDDDHVLLLLADIQTEDRQETGWFNGQSVPDVRQTVRSLGDREVFGVAAGDIMFDHLDLFGEYERGVASMAIPFFQAVGTHHLDLSATSDEASTLTFNRHFGPRYYSFERGAVHYVVLDDVFWYGGGYLGYLPQDQLDWLAADLGLVAAGRPVVVIMHIPALGSGYLRDGGSTPPTSAAVTNREALYRLLEPYQAHVLTGHTHENEHVFEGGVHEQVHGAVCGAWWSGPICGDGTPSGYSVYEVSGESLRWRYKAVGYPDSYQMRLYPPGSDPGAPEEMVANIWDWDPEWTVLRYDDGVPQGPMTRRVGPDPLSLELHSGPDLPERRPWVEPYPTGHLFYATVPTGVEQVRVEATDRFGRVHAETLALSRP
jgi:hypothetical protein